MLDDETLERGEPLAIVRLRLVRVRVARRGADRVDQALLELRPGERALAVKRDRNAERAALPRIGEHELSVLPRQRDLPAHAGDRGVDLCAHRGDCGLVTPIMQSRVTSLASSSSPIPSVPAGRSGSTK